MSVVNNANYLGVSPVFVYATADTDIFNRTHIAYVAQVLDLHQHTGPVAGGGLSVVNLNYSTALTHPGDVRITASKFTYNDSGGSSHNLISEDINCSNTGGINFSGAPTGSGLIIPVGASPVPTTNGALAYDSATNQFKGGANGSTVTFFTSGGSALPVAQGGTGDTSLTAHSVLIGEGTSAVAVATPGATAYALISNGAGSDPSFQAMNGNTALSDASVGSNKLSLTTSSAFMGGNVSTSSSLTDVTGLSLTLAAGTWIIGGWVTYSQPAGSGGIELVLRDGSGTVYTSTELNSSTSGSQYPVPLPMYVVAPGGSTTYKLSAKDVIGGGVIYASTPTTGYAHASGMWAIRIG